MSGDTFSSKKFIQAAIIMAFFWLIAVLLWKVSGSIFLLYNFLYIGTAIGIGIGLYTALPRKRKNFGRKVTQLLVGIYMLGFLGIMLRENVQIEGFFFYLLAGIFTGSVIHYLVAKILGPIFFNRGWCGWACWTAMVLDFLPYKRNKKGRLSKPWGVLRIVHFVVSLCIVLVLWYRFGYRIEKQSMAELVWLLGGNAFYYVSSISLAFFLKDNRAFCKYVCPIPTVQKITSRFALLKVECNTALCIECGACDKACPMDIQITDYTKNGNRVLSTECIICLACVNACPKGALDTTFKFDVGKQELIRFRSKEIAS